MRIVFSLLLLAGAVFYSYIAFADLNFMTRTGRLGPGFFPRVLGVAGIVVSILILLDELRGKNGAGGTREQWRDAVVLIVLTLGYAVLLRLTGGFIATVMFLGVTLSVINSGKHLTNGLVAILVPIFVYLLFDKLLNASMPPGLFELPI